MLPWMAVGAGMVAARLWQGGGLVECLFVAAAVLMGRLLVGIVDSLVKC